MTLVKYRQEVGNRFGKKKKLKPDLYLVAHRRCRVPENSAVGSDQFVIFVDRALFRHATSARNLKYNGGFKGCHIGLVRI